MTYFYAPGRSGKHAEGFLEGFCGILQMDGYAGYNRLTRSDRKGGALQLAYCWAHVRRNFFKLTKASLSPVAEEAIRRIGEFYQIEERIRGAGPFGQTDGPAFDNSPSSGGYGPVALASQYFSLLAAFFQH